MQTNSHPLFPTLRRQARACLAVAALVLLGACSPRHDWREVRGDNGVYAVALPGKPSTFSRQIDLNGIPVTMTMTASEIDKVTFAVGSAELPDASQSAHALAAMQTALVRNINGTVRQQKALQTPAGGTELEASGPAAQNTGGQPRLLLARFTARDKRVFQMIVVGPEPSVSREAADTFFTSFKVF